MNKQSTWTGTGEKAGEMKRDLYGGETMELRLQGNRT